MSLLDGGIASIFGAAFGGLYLPATLFGGEGPIYDPVNGNIIGYDTVEWPCRAQVDQVDWSMRQEGYVDGDCRIIILAAGLPGPVTSDHQIVVEGNAYRVASGYQRWALSGLTLDPAGSHWIARGRKA